MSFLDGAPDEIARQVRLAWVPPHLRALFLHLPSRIALHARVAVGRLSPTAATLLKIATLGRGLDCMSFEVGGLEPQLRFELGDRTHVLVSADLDRDLEGVVAALLSALLPPRAFLEALEAFAARAAKLAALQTLTSHMLRASDLDHALHAMLSGLSSGHGLGFHRVALFQLDEERRAFVGAKALGPVDEDEAHRIWEALEYDDKDLDALLSADAKRDVDARFEELVRGVALAPTTARGDEVALALDAPGPTRFRGDGPVNPGLGELRVGREWVLAPIRAHGRVRGLLFADDRFGDAPISDDRLAFLGFFIDQVALVWENLTLLRRVEHLARHDALTGVLARRAFEERFVEERNRAHRSGASFGLLAIDVDRFKEINDSRGHAAGDAVLRALGAILRRDVRAHDVVGRLGGDEFLVLLPGASRAECHAVARRICGNASAQGLSLSIGAACWPDDCGAPDELLPIADARLYQAKRAGRGRVSIGAGEPSEADP